MITRENLTEILNNLKEDEIKKAFDSSHEYVFICVNIFNAGWFASIESMDYDLETAQSALMDGRLFCSKKQFLNFVEQSGTTNKYLLELI